MKFRTQVQTWLATQSKSSLIHFQSRTLRVLNSWVLACSCACVLLYVLMPDTGRRQNGRSHGWKTAPCQIVGMLLGGQDKKIICLTSGIVMRNSHDPGRVAASRLGVRPGQHLNGEIPLGTATRCHRQGHEEPSFPRVF